MPTVLWFCDSVIIFWKWEFNILNFEKRLKMHTPKRILQHSFQNTAQCVCMRILSFASPGLNIQVELLELCWYKVTFIFRSNALFRALKSWLWTQMYPYLMLIKKYMCFYFLNTWWRFSGSSAVLLRWGTQPEAWTTRAEMG